MAGNHFPNGLHQPLPPHLLLDSGFWFWIYELNLPSFMQPEVQRFDHNVHFNCLSLNAMSLNRPTRLCQMSSQCMPVPAHNSLCVHHAIIRLTMVRCKLCDADQHITNTWESSGCPCPWLGFQYTSVLRVKKHQFHDIFGGSHPSKHANSCLNASST